MITAVDTNVLLDILMPGARHREASGRALSRAQEEGAVIISEPVCAELAVAFPEQERLPDFLTDARVRLQPSSWRTLYRAGHAWAAYLRRRGRLVCPQCGAAQDAKCGDCGAIVRRRQHIVADFIIGAHALEHADRLLTRDRGYYATYFPELKLG